MTLDDLGILAKKITIGILIYLIPIVIIVGGLLLTSLILKDNKKETPSYNQTKH